MIQVTSIKQQILCIATRTPQKGIDDELQAIQDIMAGRNSEFDVDIQYVTKVEQISEAIQNRTNRSKIIHICGDGTSDGTIRIPDQENGKEDELKPDTLAGFLSNAGDVDCVILNYCYSSQASKLIAEHVQCVIGIDGYIERTAAIEFSKNFYNSLEGQSLNQSGVDEAFSKGQAAALQRTEDKDKYIKLSELQPQPEMQLTEPAEGSYIHWKSTFKGTFSHWSEGASMWVYINDIQHGKFHLFRVLEYHDDGTWQQEIPIGTQNETGTTYRVGVLIADAEVTKKNFASSLSWCLPDLPDGVKKFNERPVNRLLS